jgi:hypothetical protein
LTQKESLMSVIPTGELFTNKIYEKLSSHTYLAIDAGALFGYLKSRFLDL